jgi:hypothetical protein
MKPMLLNTENLRQPYQRKRNPNYQFVKRAWYASDGRLYGNL